MNYWLIKSEPFKYSWEQFEKDRKTFWDGVRNYQARNNLRDMKKGDLCLFYHSNEDKSVMGVATVVKEGYQDPTTEETAWLAVDVSPVQKLKRPVTLQEMRADKRLAQLGLFRQPRLSVIHLKKQEFDIILSLSES
ncbi:MAG: EVE domain-containing protein [Bacteroidetes bacterium]|nr:EVE domain-containing protein [Bacteroidota bacterium]